MEKFNMFRFSVVLAIGLGLASVAQAQVKIGNNPTNINSSALLELENRPGQSRGMIFPRISLPATTSSSMGNTQTAVQGMVVYNTNAAVTGSATYPASGVGIYSFDGTGWVFGGIPSGGTSGQVLSKSATGLQWSSPSAGVLTYQASGSNTSGAGALVKATGPGVTFSVNTATQTATITVPQGVDLLSARVYDNAATATFSSYGITSGTGTQDFKIRFVFQDPQYATSFANTPSPLIDVLVDVIPPLFLTSQGQGISRQFSMLASPASNSYTVSIQLMDPPSIGAKWQILMNF